MFKWVYCLKTNCTTAYSTQVLLIWSVVRTIACIHSEWRRIDSITSCDSVSKMSRNNKQFMCRNLHCANRQPKKYEN